MGWADYWIVSVDDAGNIRWTKSYGGSNLEIGSSIAETNNGGLIIAGASASYDGHITDHIGGDDFWVVRLNFKIATARLSSHQYCPGDSITIKDTLFGTFNRNNTFSVQLSDENGSFLTPSTIAQFPNSHEDSLFRVKLPKQVKTGTHYRIRVISNSPEAIYTDNGQDITIYEQPAFTNVFLGKDTVLCNTGPLLLQAPATPGFHYTWQDNSSNHNYTVTTTGKYYVTVVNTGTVQQQIPF
ncbi:MAG TPA: hypothetical protein VJU78_01630 [Chitinophagaceae bacterium]|nr:hypothetical protein [Chitinophagaceae bacterium]